MIVNVGHPEGQDELEKVLSATMADVFPNVLRDPSQDTNTILDRHRRARVSRAPGSTRRARPCRGTCARSPPRDRGAARARLEGGCVYTDDKAPVEWLIDKSIVEYAAGAD